MVEAQALDAYRLLGRSGLRVSPLALGAMTFGEEWGADEETSRAIFDAYVSAGGNFVDTAALYSQGRSEELVGRFAEGQRDSLVIATKYAFASRPGDPNSGGNHRKSMVRGVENSLRRLGTDYIDLFYLHVWDSTTPVDEVMRGLDDLVRQGKILYAGISDTPAWQVSRMQMLAECRGWSPLVALQIEYSLLQRTVERELLPMALETGLGVLPWSPLGSGILSGKYSKPASERAGGRGTMLEANGRVTAQALEIAAKAGAIAQEIGATTAQVAIAWTLAHRAIVSPILGARTLAQFKENVGALSVTLEPAHMAALDEASAVEPGFPHDFLAGPFIVQGISGGTRIQARR